MRTREYPVFLHSGAMVNWVRDVCESETEKEQGGVSEGEMERVYDLWLRCYSEAVLRLWKRAVDSLASLHIYWC